MSSSKGFKKFTKIQSNKSALWLLTLHNLN